MKNIRLMLLLLASTTTFAQDFYTRELLNLADFSTLPQYRSGEMNQLSSYDRTGGNDDGFSGKYSFIREEPGGLVIADLKGPGVVNRIWTPTPTTDTINFYFDGERTPRISIPFIDLFTGNHPPFEAPLSGNQIGGYYCYLPIPYERSLKIVYKGKTMRFHQTQYRTLSSKDQVKSFSNDLVRSHADGLKRVAAIWTKQVSPLNPNTNGLKRVNVNTRLQAGVDNPILSLNTGGRIVGIELDAGSLPQLYRKIMLTARWDGDANPALDVPLHDFFGFAFGKAAMQSILIGAHYRQFYSYIPMPFDKTAEVKLRYEKGKNDPDDVPLSGTIYYTDEKRNAATEGRFYVQSRRQYNIPSGEPHLIADVSGKGHYIGTVLMSQGLETGHTNFFEGDDQATIDGNLKLHGTGSEDYFNGGWYAVMDRWDRGISLPIHGSLDYNLMGARTGGYRFYLTDKLNFGQRFRLTIEHQPEAKTNVQTDYTSLGFFYADKPAYKNTPILIDPKANGIVHYDKLTAQVMTFTLYWLASAHYEDPAIVFSMNKSDKWFATIDPEAVPMAQILLNGLDNGRYKLHVEYGKSDHPNPFSIWQRSAQISDWIDPGKDMPSAGGKTVYAGEIEVTDEVKTITIRKQAEQTEVRIHNLLFEKMN